MLLCALPPKGFSGDDGGKSAELGAERVAADFDEASAADGGTKGLLGDRRWWVTPGPFSPSTTLKGLLLARRCVFTPPPPGDWDLLWLVASRGGDRRLEAASAVLVAAVAAAAAATGVLKGLSMDCDVMSGARTGLERVELAVGGAEAKGSAKEGGGEMETGVSVKAKASVGLVDGPLFIFGGECCGGQSKGGERQEEGESRRQRRGK